jgi:hypothetical protein
MPVDWTLEKLQSKTPQQIQMLYTRARVMEDDSARRLVSLILDNDLLAGDHGGLPWDHPDMLEIQDICDDPGAVDEAVAASEKGLPALAGMEHRLVAALAERYGPNFTTNHAGRCIKEGMLDRGWVGTVQKPMPDGSVAKSATVFVKRTNK